jgi:hypothetical protein
MYQTFDHRFILKTINKSEVKTLLKMLDDVHSYLANNSTSYLTRILGLYRMERTGKNSFYLIIMECILPPLDKLLCVFDLKGSKEGRRKLNDALIGSIEMIPVGIVCKDLDFLQTQKQLQLEPADYLALMSVLSCDIELLSRQGVMDYSLLLGMTDDEALLKPYAKYSVKATNGLHCCFGVIDFLQSYNYRKRLETFGLVIRKKDQPSCVKPTLYSERFLRFMAEVIRPLL